MFADSSKRKSRHKAAKQFSRKSSRSYPISELAKRPQKARKQPARQTDTSESVWLTQKAPNWLRVSHRWSLVRSLRKRRIRAVPSDCFSHYDDECQLTRLAGALLLLPAAEQLRSFWQFQLGRKCANCYAKNRLK